MVILTLTEKGGEPRQLSFEKNEVTVGRVQGNDVVLPKGNVSKRHCRIYIQDGHFSVEDLKSTNGTYVNGRKISEPTALTTADKVYVGDFVVRVDNATPAEVPTPPPPGNEAGSLSSALSRRPPPPPPRATGTMRTLVEDPEPPQRSRSSSSMRLPPPPPPPRRDSRPMPALGEDEPPTPNITVPADIDLDDESLASAPPRLNVPPLKPVMPVSARAPEREDLGDLSEEPEREPPTANRGRGLLSKSPPPATSDLPGWLRKLLDGDGAAAVYVAGPESVEIEREGRREPANLSPSESETLADNLRALAGRGTPRPAPDAPVVNVTLADGSRLVAVFPPAAAQVCAAIHRSAGAQKSLGDLAAEGALSQEMQQVLEACTSTRRNVIVSGDRRAAELLLQALANTIASRFRVVVMADRVAAPAGSPWIKLAPEPRNPDIMTAAIALRPDYLIVDVIAASTAADLLQECAVGQEGVLAAVAARSAGDALSRLQALAGSALGGGNSVRELLAGSFDLIVHASITNEGNLRVLEIAEPRSDVDGRVVAEPLLAWRADEERNGGGRFQTTNARSRLAATLAARGVEVPASVLQR